MTARKSSYLAVGLLLAAAFLPAGAVQTVAGSWSLRSAEAPDRVQLAFVHDRSTESSSNWRLAALTGLDLSPASRHDVHFAIERDALGDDILLTPEEWAAHHHGRLSDKFTF